MPTRHSFVLAFTRFRRPDLCAQSTTRRCATRSWRRWRGESTAVSPRSTITATAARRRVRCRKSSSSTPARERPARSAAGRSRGSSSAGARPITSRTARYGCAAPARVRRQRALALFPPALPGTAAPPPSDSSGNLGGVAGTTLKTEAVVLRSIRYGEADRILHLYSATRGRMGAIAKGARRPKSRFGGRLEPFFRLDLILHEGRGELLTVTNVATVDGYPRLRASGPALGAGARACDAVLRLLDSTEANSAAYNLLCRYLTLLDDPAAQRAAAIETALSFRLKLALAAGFSPELASCARCGEAEHPAGR